MELSEWIRQFNEARRFQVQAEQQKGLSTPIAPSSLAVCWPDGQAWDSEKPFWVEETGETYETLDQAIDGRGGEMPSYASFGLVRFNL